MIYRYHYFVYFQSGSQYGNGSMERERKVETYEDVKELEQSIKTQGKYEGKVILKNFILLREEMI